MYLGAHSRKDSKPRFPTNKAAVLLLSMILLIGIAVGTTVAFLVARTKPMKSTFEYAKVSCEVTGSKENVQIKNTGNTAAYIRATYIVTWRDGQGENANIVPAPDESEYAYSLDVNPDKAWLLGNDGYFYYPTPIGPGESTKGSLLNCTVTKQPENYFLHVEVLAEAIQSTPVNAVHEAWGVTVTDGMATPVLGN